MSERVLINIPFLLDGGYVSIEAEDVYLALNFLNAVMLYEKEKKEEEK